jgi:hypothetical protein
VIHDVDVITKHIDMERHAIFDMVYGDYEQARTIVYLQPKEGRENYRIPHTRISLGYLREAAHLVHRDPSV